MKRNQGQGRLRPAMGARAQQRRRGQALVEFALMLPMIMLLCLAIVDFTRVYAAAILLEDAAREGARLATNYNKTDAEVQARIIATASPYTLTASNITVCVNTASCPPVQGGSMASRTSANSGQSVMVTVQLSVNFATSFITEWVGLGTINVVGTAKMVIM